MANMTTRVIPSGVCPRCGHSREVVAGYEGDEYGARTILGKRYVCMPRPLNCACQRRPS